MKLCECGCGKEVKTKGCRFTLGHHSRSKETTEKRKQTCMLRYGRDNVSKVDHIQAQKTDTSWKNHGTASPNQAQSVKDKKVKTCRKHFDCDHPAQCKEVRDKAGDTMFKNHGVRYATQSPIFQEKSRLTSQENWNTDHPMQSEIVQELVRLGIRKSLNVDNPSQSEIVKRKKRDTNRKNCGYDYNFQSPEGRRISRQVGLKFVDDQIMHGEPWMPRVGIQERPFLDELQQYIQYKIIRQDPSFKQSIARIPDGYIPDLNLIVLFNEKDHFIDKQTCLILDEDSVQTIEDYKSENLTVFHISEIYWKNNKDETIKKFIELIDMLKNSQELTS